MQLKIETTKEKVTLGRQIIIEKGGHVDTDNNFSISGVKGFYHFENGLLIINITNKPWLATKTMIKSKIISFFK